MASSAAIVIAALVVVLFKFKSIVATVIVVAFVVAFDEPMMPFGSLVATLLPFSWLITVLPSLPQEVQLWRFKFNRRGAKLDAGGASSSTSKIDGGAKIRRICSPNTAAYVSK